MAWSMLLTGQDAVWVRYLLSQELCRMKRPDLSDLLSVAGFEMQGRHLLIAIPGHLEMTVDPVLSAAVLNCGLPADSAALC